MTAHLVLCQFCRTFFRTFDSITTLKDDGFDSTADNKLEGYLTIVTNMLKFMIKTNLVFWNMDLSNLVVKGVPQGSIIGPTIFKPQDYQAAVKLINDDLTKDI